MPLLLEAVHETAAGTVSSHCATGSWSRMIWLVREAVNTHAVFWLHMQWNTLLKLYSVLGNSDFISLFFTCSGDTVMVCTQFLQYSCFYMSSHPLSSFEIFFGFLGFWILLWPFYPDFILWVWKRDFFFSCLSASSSDSFGVASGKAYKTESLCLC